MFIWFVVVILALAVSGIIYQATGAARDSRRYRPNGQMVDIGNRRMHLVVAGEDNGMPTVILEAGIISFSSNWYWVQAELAADMRVVAYDRAGLGWSDPPLATQHAYQSAEDLYKALENAGIGGPYVVAGHSYGGLVVRAFADRYSDSVVGMVLVDASHPDQWDHMPVSRNGQVNAVSTRLTGWLVRFGIVRLVRFGSALWKGLPERPAAEMKAIINLPRSWATAGATLSIWHNQTRPLINQAQSLGDLPLYVLSVSEQSLMAETLTSLQEELPRLSTNSRRTIVKGASHESLVAEQEHAQAIVTAIRQVVKAARTGQSLSNISISLSELVTQ